MADTDLLLEWANDAEARRFAFTAGPIDHVTHVAWLRAKLADPTVLLFVAADRSGTPLGQVRFEITGSRAVISVSVAAPRRGEGWGAALVLAGVRALFASSAASDCSVVIAEIKDGNDRSARVFELADFELASEHEDGRGRWRSYARLRDA
jgi:RimJ/RimL family protein N-acetyltransferase